MLRVLIPLISVGSHLVLTSGIPTISVTEFNLDPTSTLCMHLCLLPGIDKPHIARQHIYLGLLTPVLIDA
jgi:hypothetical protein